MLDGDRYRDCLYQAHEASAVGRVEEALAWLDEAQKHNPLGAEAHNDRGWILWENGRPEEALREFTRSVEADPGFQEGQLNRIELLVEEFQEYEEALETGDSLLQSRLEPHVEAEVYYLKAKALFYLDDLAGALFLLRRALQVGGDVDIYRGFEGQILFEVGEFEAAGRVLERAELLGPQQAHTLYHLALVREHLGDYEIAEEFFAAAAELDGDAYPRPVRVPAEAFEQMAQHAVRGLPQNIQRYVANCPILIDDLPRPELVREESLSPQILGLFQGVPATDPGASPTFGGRTVESPDYIVLFKRNLEKVAAGSSELIEQVQVTVRHEIGHYLGLNEDDLDRLGLG